MAKIKTLSYSEMSQFWRDRKVWHDRYILGKFEPPNNAMVIGKIVHQYIENPQFEIFKELKALKLHPKKLTQLRKMLNKVMPKRPPDARRDEGWHEAVRHI